jgi:transposase
MLDLDTREAILTMTKRKVALRKIAETLHVSRNAVRRVLHSGEREVPGIERPLRLDEHLDLVVALADMCKGNLTRVAECLEDRGIEVGYATLTAFCRRHGIGVEPPKVAGRYHFEPGSEMQHDTSPHRVEIAGTERVLQCASLVLCYSRVLFAQVYVRWSRLEARAFLTEALVYLQGAAARCIVDNLSVIVAHGTGNDAVMASEMSAFAQHFGFHFRAHEKGDVNRSARVERPFHFIEHNFYPGRTFASIEDCNAQMRAWCDKVAHRRMRELQATPLERFATEVRALKPLPAHLPEPYVPHRRRLDVEGFVTLHTNRYSVPIEQIGRALDVHEYVRRLRVFDGHRLVAEHDKCEPGMRMRVQLKAHHSAERWKNKPPAPSPMHSALVASGSELAALVAALERRHGGHAPRHIERLHRIWCEYPTDSVNTAVRTALAHDLTDLERIERMVLRHIGTDFFRLPIEPPAPPEYNDD